MVKNTKRPILITFDGEARSGKGTIVQAVKDSLREDGSYKVMLIDAGQVFRSLVVMAAKNDVDPDSPSAIDTFLSDEEAAERCVQFVKEVYHMEKSKRDALLYTNEVSKNSAKFGARPLCQEFKDSLLKKWLRDAAIEGYEIVLLDGRALEEVGMVLESEGFCTFMLGFYFMCDPIVGARRTLGYYDVPYNELSREKRAEVDELVREINDRNNSDRNRQVQPIVPPKDALKIRLPTIVVPPKANERVMAVIDTSADMTKNEMTAPVSRLIQAILTGNNS